MTSEKTIQKKDLRIKFYSVQTFCIRLKLLTTVCFEKKTIFVILQALTADVHFPSSMFKTWLASYGVNIEITDDPDGTDPGLLEFLS